MITPYINGCIVLSSRQATSFPLFSLSSLNKHIEGSFNGSVGLLATCQTEIYNPSKGRVYYAGSTSQLADSDFHLMVSALGEDSASDGLHSLRDAFHHQSNDLLLSEPSVVCLEQRTPFGFIGIHSRHVEVYFYGLYNSKCAVLYWSTSDNIEDVLIKNHGGQFWVYRFRPRKDFSTILYVKRMCSRWFRWGQTLPDNAQKFYALESSITNSIVHNGQQPVHSGSDS